MSYILPCPHCWGMVQLPKKQLNCRIYRHALYKTGRQVSPHAKKERIEKLLREGKIIGCGMPFKFNDFTKNIEKCDWI